MTTYKGINGTAVQNYAGNLPGAADGQIWYDSTNTDFKYQYPNVSAAGSWRAGGSLNTARGQLATSGTQTSAIAAGGLVPPNSPSITAETYNGSNWTEVNDLNTGRYGLSGAGADGTSAVVFGGFTSPPDATYNNTETFNGTNWTEVNNLNTARFHFGAAGATNTAALAIGGYTVPPVVANTES